MKFEATKAGDGFVGTGKGIRKRRAAFVFPSNVILYLVSYIVYSLLHKYSGHVPRQQLQKTACEGKILNS